jgi:lipooligosaccharide transport system permease protein
VLVREIINFGSYWRSSTFASIVQPLIYLLAFGVRLRLAREDGGRPRLRRFVATGTVATAVLFSSVFPAMFGTFVKYKFQRTYDAIPRRAGRHRGARHRRDAVDRARAAFFGCFPIVIGFFFGLDPTWGMLTVPFIALPRRTRLDGLRHFHRRGAEVDRRLQLRDEHGHHAAVPRRGHVLPAFRGCPTGSHYASNANPLFHCVELVHHAAFGFKGWVDVGHLAFLVGFALATWRVAIHYMARRVID